MITSPASMIKNEIVANAGPLIYLSILDRFHLLKDLFKKVLIPEAVFDEVVIVGKAKPGEKEVKRALEEGWLKKTNIKNKLAVQGMSGRLHKGEIEAIVLAKESGINRVILDDLSARKKAYAMNLKVIGTAGILILAFKIGINIDLKEELDNLIENGYRISKKLYQKILHNTSLFD